MTYDEFLEAAKAAGVKGSDRVEIFNFVSEEYEDVEDVDRKNDMEGEPDESPSLVIYGEVI